MIQLFEFNDPQIISNIDTLFSLNIQKTYYRPGDATVITDPLSAFSFHMTSGIFRGQLNDWPLIPKLYRNLKNIELPASEAPRSFRWFDLTRQFRSFCDRSQAQNFSFPSRYIERMTIAQHFGIPTPLLDWSSNIFTAIYFAIRETYNNPEFEKSLKVFIYHIIDEQYLHSGIPNDADIEDVNYSAFIKGIPIDRRIERQQGVFTFHPHPGYNPKKIPVNKYILEWPTISKLIDLMKGLNYTEDYYFPDYAGIARAVLSEKWS